jgi:hypothetical protein
MEAEVRRANMIKRMSLVCRGEESAEVTDQSEPFYKLLAPRLTLKRNYSVYLKAAASALASANLILFYSCHDAETAPSFSILGTPHPPVTASSVIVPVLYQFSQHKHREWRWMFVIL